MADPGPFNFIIYQGATLEKTFTCKDDSNAPVDISAYHARITAREGLRSSTSIFNYNSVTHTSNLTEPNASGYFTFTMSAADTAALDFTTAYYSVELYDEGTPVEVHRLNEGIIRLSKEVTSG